MIDYLSHMSIRRRITLSIFFSFLIILPIVSMSLFYFTSLINQITVIIEKDARLGNLAAELSLTMLDIQRYEMNYRIFGSVTDHEIIEKMIARTDSTILTIREISSGPERELAGELSEHLTIYSNSFKMLVEHTSQHPPEDRIDTIKAHLSETYRDFRSNYRTILGELNKATTSAQRDSIIAKAREYMDSLSFESLLSSELPPAQSGEPEYIYENLRTSRQSFLTSAKNLSDNSWNDMQAHKRESLRIEARARRNIITVLFLTGFIGLFIVGILPRKIVRPITTLTRILKNAEEGDLSVEASIQTKDEIGELAASYNSVLARVRMYDDLKTRKIASQKRIIERILENFTEPACVVTVNLGATFYNAPFAALFGENLPSKPPEGGLPIETIAALNDFTSDIQKTFTGTNNFSLVVTGTQGTAVQMRGRLVRNTLMELEAVVLIGVSEET